MIILGYVVDLHNIIQQKYSLKYFQWKCYKNYRNINSGDTLCRNYIKNMSIKIINQKKEVSI